MNDIKQTTRRSILTRIIPPVYLAIFMSAEVALYFLIPQLRIAELP